MAEPGEAKRPSPEAEEVAIVRVESLYPFPQEELAKILAGYPNLRELVWTQEEPENMGAWAFVAPKLQASVTRSALTASALPESRRICRTAAR